MKKEEELSKTKHAIQQREANAARDPAAAALKAAGDSDRQSRRYFLQGLYRREAYTALREEEKGLYKAQELEKWAQNRFDGQQSGRFITECYHSILIKLHRGMASNCFTKV